MKTILVTGTDTNVGKTHVSCTILRQLRRAGHRTGAFKPVCSGAEQDVDGRLFWNDIEKLHAELSTDVDRRFVCPQQFRLPLAPNVAAAAEGRSVDDRLLAEGTEYWQSRCDYLVVEGAGGLLCPLSDTSTVLDLAVNLKSPVLVVAANRLGVINHTLLTVRAAQQAGLTVSAVVVNETLPHSADESAASNVDQLRRWLPDTRILTCAYGSDELSGASDGQRMADATVLFDSL